MAERRMFAKTIIDSDAFLDMPSSAQALYFHLGMRADDEGFINNAKKIQRMIGASDDDLKLLIAKKFVIPFDTGIIVIKHWKIHNYIRKDRIKDTVYQAEKAYLTVKQNGSYTLCQSVDGQVADKCQHRLDQVRLDQVRLDQVRLDQVRLGQVRLGQDNNSANKSHRFIPPTLEEVTDYCQERNKGVNPQRWYDFYTAKGWMIGKNKMKDWKAAVRTWESKQDKPIGGNIFLQEDV